MENQIKHWFQQRRMLVIVTWMSCLSAAVCAQDLYVSTSFHEPATEGLRFIYSHDGVKWDSIQGVFLRPEVGQQKVTEYAQDLTHNPAYTGQVKNGASDAV